MKKFFFTVAVFTVAAVSTFAARTVGSNIPPMVEPPVAGIVMPPVAGPGKTATPLMADPGRASSNWWTWIIP